MIFDSFKRLKSSGQFRFQIKDFVIRESYTFVCSWSVQNRSLFFAMDMTSTFWPTYCLIWLNLSSGLKCVRPTFMKWETISKPYPSPIWVMNTPKKSQRRSRCEDLMFCIFPLLATYVRGSDAQSILQCRTHEDTLPRKWSWIENHCEVVSRRKVRTNVHQIPFFREKLIHSLRWHHRKA